MAEHRSAPGEGALLLAEAEREFGIVEEEYDISPRSLGVPPTKKFYRAGEVDFDRMDREFQKERRRLGLVSS